MFTIEKGIPIPQNAGRKSKYPFSDMKVGDSFFVEGKTAAGLYASCRKASEKLDAKFIARTVSEDVWEEDDEGDTVEKTLEGVRVWRTS